LRIGGVGAQNGWPAGTQGKRPKGRPLQTWGRRDTVRRIVWKGVSVMARKRDRWEAVCAFSAPDGRNKRLD